MFCTGQPFICALLHPRNRFISLSEVPLPNLGFSLMGFITFHSYISIRLVSLTLLQILSIVSLRRFSAVRHYPAQAYRFAWHKHYIHLRMCEHGLSSGITSGCLNITFSIIALPAGKSFSEYRQKNKTWYWTDRMLSVFLPARSFRN